MAPVMIEYIKWVLSEAIKQNKKRLYFLARDGYQMYIVAKYLSEKWNLGIECKYLKVSRYAIRVPEYHLLEKKCLDNICIGGIDVTFEKIMKRAALNDEEALEIAKECGYADKYKEVLNYNEIMSLKPVLLNCDKFFKYVYKYSKEAYNTAVGYLMQEGLMDDIEYGLVDSGWVGTLQQSIQKLVQSRKPDKVISGFYFGMYGIPHEVDKELYHTFYFSEVDGLWEKVYFSNCLFEAIFTAPDGMTVGYEMDIESMNFIAKTDLKENTNAKEIRKNIQVLKKYLQCYNGDVSELDVHKKRSKVLIKQILKAVMGKPTKYEVGVYGGLLFSDDVLEGHLQKVAAELSEEDIRNQQLVRKILIMSGIKKATLHESAWIEGSIVANGRNVNKYLRHAHLYKLILYIRKRLKVGR